MIALIEIGAAPLRNGKLEKHVVHQLWEERGEGERNTPENDKKERKRVEREERHPRQGTERHGNCTPVRTQLVGACT